MLITVRGRVESDPMRIPTPARTKDAQGDSFASLLQEASEPAPAVRTEAEAEEAREPVPVDPEPETLRAHDEAIADEAAPDADAPTETGEQTFVGVSATETIRNPGAPSRPHENQSQPIEAPRPEKKQGDALLIAALQHNARSAPATTLSSGTASVAASAPTRLVEATVRGVEGAQARTSAPLRAPGVAAGYRANGKASAELVDQARDSVFKQILLKLSGEGGEMRMRLEPPELGELDLRVVVERGNQVSLWIGAERPELAAMLQKNLDELRHALQSSGLEITDAQVGTRGQGTGERPDGARHGDTDRDPQLDAEPARRFGGWVSAEGLDFWA